MREDPRDAESKSHRLLVRGGFIKQLASGIHTYLPLGWRVLSKIAAIIREEMDRVGCQEMLCPAIAPKEIWAESGRWYDYGDDMFRFKDRKNRDYCLCPTHEEIMTDIARTAIRSYRDMPQIWYQIQTKFRDEPRPRFGVIRSRHFIMKDSYSFDRDEKGLDASFNLHQEAYCRIFTRCGLDFVVVDASGGIMGTGESKEFMALVEGGEDRVMVCGVCDFKANLDVAEGKGEYRSYADSAIQKVETPDRKTVEEVSAFLKVTADNLVKNMFYAAPGKQPVLVLVRGDYEINENKVKKAIGVDFAPASADEIVKHFSAEPGYIGPVGVSGIAVYADDLLKDTKGMITGANQNGYHIKGFNISRDIKVTAFINLRMAHSGDRCMKCGGELNLRSALELGHIFKLGTKYSVALGAHFIDEHGKEQPVVMGSYGIGLERIMACAAEQLGDDKGMVWPITIAPYDIYIVVLNPQEKNIQTLADETAASLMEAGFAVIVDDRDLAAGVKFTDAELLGMPIRLTIGPKGIKNNRFDISIRQTGEVSETDKTSITGRCREIKEKLLVSINE